MNDKIDERTISSIDHQYDMARLERIIKRLWIVILSLLILFAGTNALWIYEWNQYDYGEITVDSDNGGNAKYMLVSVNYFLTSNSWHALTSPSSEGLFLLRVFFVIITPSLRGEGSFLLRELKQEVTKMYI